MNARMSGRQAERHRAEDLIGYPFVLVRSFGVQDVAAAAEREARAILAETEAGSDCYWSPVVHVPLVAMQRCWAESSSALAESLAAFVGEE